MKYNFLILLVMLTVFTACKNDNSGQKKPQKEEKLKFGQSDDPSLPMEKRAELRAKILLGIPATEKITIKLFSADLNDDDQSDALVTINRLEAAKENADKLKTKEILMENGYVGNYNYFMIYDGATNQFSIPVPIPSSAERPLEVDFINLFSDKYSTPVITYRIRDTEFRNFYNISADGVMDKVFKMISYENVGSPKQRAYVYEIENKGTFSPVKDIYVYDGILENAKELSLDYFGASSKIKKTKKLYKRWFYDPRQVAYVTPDK